MLETYSCKDLFYKKLESCKVCKAPTDVFFVLDEEDKESECAILNGGMIPCFCVKPATNVTAIHTKKTENISTFKQAKAYWDRRNFFWKSAYHIWASKK